MFSIFVLMRDVLKMLLGEKNIWLSLNHKPCFSFTINLFSKMLDNAAPVFYEVEDLRKFLLVDIMNGVSKLLTRFRVIFRTSVKRSSLQDTSQDNTTMKNFLDFLNIVRLVVNIYFNDVVCCHLPISRMLALIC